MPVLGFVHTIHRVIPSLAAIAHECCPEIEQRHYLDESTLQDTITTGRLTPEVTRRVCALILQATERCDAVLLTCSSIGPCADIAQRMTPVPVWRIDAAMAEEAVARGCRIGVVATLPTTLEPTAELVRKAAVQSGKDVEVVAHLCEGAFAAAGAGRGEEHDALVRDGLLGLRQGHQPVDVIVLAQASMARIADQVAAQDNVPILASPHSGIARAADMLRNSLAWRE